MSTPCLCSWPDVVSRPRYRLFDACAHHRLHYFTSAPPPGSSPFFPTVCLSATSPLPLHVSDLPPSSPRPVHRPAPPHTHLPGLCELVQLPSCFCTVCPTFSPVFFPIFFPILGSHILFRPHHVWLYLRRLVRRLRHSASSSVHVIAV